MLTRKLIVLLTLIYCNETQPLAPLIQTLFSRIPNMEFKQALPFGAIGFSFLYIFHLHRKINRFEKKVTAHFVPQKEFMSTNKTFTQQILCASSQIKKEFKDSIEYLKTGIDSADKEILQLKKNLDIEILNRVQSDKINEGKFQILLQQAVVNNNYFLERVNQKSFNLHEGLLKSHDINNLRTDSSGSRTELSIGPIFRGQHFISRHDSSSSNSHHYFGKPSYRKNEVTGKSTTNRVINQSMESKFNLD